MIVDALALRQVFCRREEFILSLGWMDGWMDGCERRRTLTAIDLKPFGSHALALGKGFPSPGRIC